jgi:hypothetical protein
MMRLYPHNIRLQRFTLLASACLLAGLAVAAAMEGAWMFILRVLFAGLALLSSHAGRAAYRAGYFNGRYELLRQMSEGHERGLRPDEIAMAILEGDDARSADRRWP